MKAKYIYESVRDFLKPKSIEDIDKDFKPHPASYIKCQWILKNKIMTVDNKFMQAVLTLDKINTWWVDIYRYSPSQKRWIVIDTLKVENLISQVKEGKKIAMIDIVKEISDIIKRYKK